MAAKPNLNKLHEAAINQYQANVTDEREANLDKMARTINAMIAFYAACLAVIKAAAMSTEDQSTMSGGKYHGETGKADSPLFYSGTKTYPSQGYCSKAFMLKYLHMSGRLAEYRATNSTAKVDVYIKWLQLMYGWSKDHTKLSRDPEGTLKQFTPTPATKADKAAGKAFHSLVYIEPTSESGTPAPSVIRDAITAAMKMTPAQQRKITADYDMGNWKNESIVEVIQAAVAQIVLNLAADKTAKSKKKSAKV
jgi:hypothetical protein